MKYIVSYRTKFGNVSAESDRADDLVSGYESLKRIATRLEADSGLGYSSRRFRRNRIAGTRSKVARRNSYPGRGRGETTSIIRLIESKLLESSFFSRPRSTGETKKRVDSVSGRNYTSRKVSQALGILWKKGVLVRTGTRNYYTYSK